VDDLKSVGFLTDRTIYFSGRQKGDGMHDHRDELSPCYSWFLRDWRASHRVSKMSWKERGFYRECLDWSWDLDGLPPDLEFIRERLKATVGDFNKLWPVVKQMYVLAEDQRYRNPRQELERAKQRGRKQRATAGGKSGGRGRSGSAAEIAASYPSSYPPTLEKQIGDSPYRLLPSLLPSPSPSLAPAQQIANAPPVMAVVDEEIGERGGRLVERYGVLYQHHRHGAHFRQRPNLDWLEACDLCRHWDDPTLEKLAILVLTTDDPWITKSDRSFHIFALKATWADGRLKQWEHEQGAHA
jgi:hypothetical protein